MFISRKLLPHEKNYVKVEKECLDIKWAVEKLKYYLLMYLRFLSYLAQMDVSKQRKKCTDHSVVSSLAGLPIYSGTLGWKLSC